MHYLYYFFLIFRSIMRTNFRIGGNKKQRFSILFFPNNNVGGSEIQSIIKKALKLIIYLKFISFNLYETNNVFP